MVFFVTLSPECSLDPKLPLISRNKNPNLGFASGQRPLSCLENPQPDNTVVSCQEGLWCPLGSGCVEEKSRQARRETSLLTLPALLTLVLGSVMLVHIDFSNFAMPLVYKTL